GITPCVPANRAINNQGDGTLFDRSLFDYDNLTDSYRCPAGRTLVRKQIMRRDNCVLYAAHDCSECALKPRCTSAERRFLTRHFHEHALQRMNARIEADPGLMRQRRCAAEHPFGTIKRMTAGGRFLTRGLAKVRAEAALSVLAYNILRAMNLNGATRLRDRIARPHSQRCPGTAGTPRVHTDCNQRAFLYFQATTAARPGRRRS